MRAVTLGVALLATCALGLTGCSSKGIQYDEKATIRYDSVRDGVPKDIGPGGGAGKGKKPSGAGAAAPP